MKKLTILTIALIFISCDMITNDLQKEVDKLRDQTEQLQEDVTTLQEEINSLEESNTETEAEIDSLEIQLLLLSAELTILGSEVDSTDSELLSLIESLQTQMELLQAQIAALQFRFKEYQIAFKRYSGSGGFKKQSLYFMNPDNPEDVIKIWENDMLGSALDWSPDGKKLVISIREDGGNPCNLHIYDVISRTHEKILHTNSISWQASWSPMGDWIAFIDDLRYGFAGDELVLIHSMTKEVIWFGDTPQEEFRGMHPSWDPTGKRIALSTRFTTASGEKTGKRIGIYSDLWGDPQREALHTEEYLQDEFGVESQDIDEGINGIAWSPDGSLIAYGFFLGWDLGKICIANADGSGVVRVLPYENVHHPSWSPDSQYLIFNIPGGHIFRVNRQGDDLEDLSLLSGISQNAQDSSPRWAN